MDGSSPSAWRPEPEPQNDLERQLPRMAGDPALHGRMFRMLWDAELTILMPDHPEMRDGFEVGNGSTITFVNYADAEGPFVPVFTSEAAADHAVQKLSPKPWPLLATSVAEVIFRALTGGDAPRVIINPGLSTCIVLTPEAVARLVAGDFTHRTAGTGEKTSMSVMPVPADQIPATLRDGIRDFCAKRRVPIGVYVFHPFDPATRQPDATQFSIVLWLRHANDDFYNDFSLLVGRLIPEGCQSMIGVVTPEDESALVYLQTCTPLWPVLPEWIGRPEANQPQQFTD